MVTWRDLTIALFSSGDYEWKVPLVYLHDGVAPVGVLDVSSEELTLTEKEEEEEELSFGNSTCCVTV